MAVIRLAGFGGENRALHPLLLPEMVGTTSLNQKPGRGDLRPWNDPLAITVSLPSGGIANTTKTIYRMGLDNDSETEYWLNFPYVAHVVRGPNASDTAERTYYTGGDQPKWLDSASYNSHRLLGVKSPLTPLVLGITPPAAVLSSALVIGTQYTITTSGSTSWAAAGASRPEVLAGAFVTGTSYVIKTLGGTDFTVCSNSLFSANNPAKVGDTFTASAVGSGSGVVTQSAWVGTVFTATATATGTGTATINNTLTETRYYTYTCVNSYDQESAPADPVGITCKTHDTITINNMSLESGYLITRYRIYRTQTGSSGTEFFFLRETGSEVSAPNILAATIYTIYTVGNTDFTKVGASSNAVGVVFTATHAGTVTGVDGTTGLVLIRGTANTTDDNRSLGEVLPTTTWLMPPADLKWLTGLWNGMMCGISGRSVRFCEAFVPYAWPIAYEILASNTTPVALATFGQTLVILTNGSPSLVTGGTPDSMDEQPTEFLQACVAPLSAVSMGHGVAWASPDGLAYIGSGGAKMLTEGVMTREDWQAINPSSIIGCMYERRYLGFYNAGTDADPINKAFMLDPTNPQGLYFMNFGAKAVYLDDLQDKLFIFNVRTDGSIGTISKWDGSAGVKTATFKSKTFRMPKPVVGFGCAEVTATSYGTGAVRFRLYSDTATDPTIDYNKETLGSGDAVEGKVWYSPTTRELKVYRSSSWVNYDQFKRTTLDMKYYEVAVTSSTPFRLPSGYHAQAFQIEIISTVAVQGVAVAHSMQELAQV